MSEQVQNQNTKIVERDKIDTTITQIHDLSVTKYYTSNTQIHDH